MYFFQTDWNDGVALASLVQNLGGAMPGWPDHINHGDHEGVITKGNNPFYFHNPYNYLCLTTECRCGVAIFT